MQADLSEHLGGRERIAPQTRGELDVLECREIGDKIIKLKDKAHVVAAVFREALLVKG